VGAPPNKGMKLTKLSAAPTLAPQAALTRRCRRMPAPSRSHAGTASQLIPGVRRTNGRAHDRRGRSGKYKCNRTWGGRACALTNDNVRRGTDRTIHRRYGMPGRADSELNRRCQRQATRHGDTSRPGDHNTRTDTSQRKKEDGKSVAERNRPTSKRSGAEQE
jgi:hypothetical protein